VTEGLAQRLLRLSSGCTGDVVGWRAFGDDAGYAVDRRILIELPPPTCWSCCDRCEGECEGRWIDWRDGALLAVCPLDSADRIVLDPIDLRLFEIDLKQLATAIRDDSGLEGNGPDALIEGVWSLGHTPSHVAPTLVALAFETAFDALPGMIDRLKRSPGLVPVTLLTAGTLRLAVREHLENAGIRVASALEVIASDLPLLFRLKPEALAPPLVESRLIIAQGARTVTAGGRMVCLTPKPFQLLLYLGQQAQKTDAWIEARRIETDLWGHGAPIQGATNQVRRVRDAVKEAFPGLDAPQIIETGNNSYRIAPRYCPVAIRA
jgi:hypothetical protein